MTQSDSSSFTTWSHLKKRNSENHLRRLPSGNNNNSGDDATQLGLTEQTYKSQSMPNLFKKNSKNIVIVKESFGGKHKNMVSGYLLISSYFF